MALPEERAGVGKAAKDVVEHARAIAKLEARLAVAEMKERVVSLGLGTGLVVGAALLALFAVGFAGATVAAALATVLDVWLALLVVTLLYAALAGSSGSSENVLSSAAAHPFPGRQSKRRSSSARQ